MSKNFVEVLVMLASAVVTVIFLLWLDANVVDFL